MKSKINLIKLLSFGAAFFFLAFMLMMSPFAAMAGPIGLIEILFMLFLSLLIATPGILIQLGQWLKRG